MYLAYRICFALAWWLIYSPLRLYGRLTKSGLFLREIHNQERLAHAAGHGVWIHVASAGEVVAAMPVVKALKKEYPGREIILTVVSHNGYVMAQKMEEKVDEILFFPFDHKASLARMMDILQPVAIVLTETEMWPNFLHCAKEKDVPVMMMNGRLSENSLMYYQWCKPLMKPLLKSIKVYAMQSETDKKRVIALGAEPERVAVTGNTKWEDIETAMSDKDIMIWKRRLSLTGREPVLVAGSTHEGEEEILLSSYKRIRQTYPSARLLLAPRDISRKEEIKALALAHGQTAIGRTDIEKTTEAPVVIIDTLGEVRHLYHLATVVFVGGSLVPVGGHNVLEAAALGKPVIVGPHMENFKEIYDLLSSRGACLTVRNEEELTETTERILGNEEKGKEIGEKALAVAAERQGAAKRNVALLKTLWEED